jgi:hypothetical protein
MAKVGEVAGSPERVAVSTTDAGMVSLWMGLESSDLKPDAADQLAAFLRVAANRARRLGAP